MHTNSTARHLTRIELDIEQIADLDVSDFDQAHVFGGGSSHTTGPLPGSSHTTAPTRA